MPHAVTVADLVPLVRSRRALLSHGWTERAITSGVQSGSLRLIRRGSYMLDADWSQLWSEGKHLAHVIAVAREASGRAVMSHVSAAVLWGLPLYRLSPRMVHMTTDSPTRISSGSDVMRHVTPLPPGDIVRISGISVTSLQRTVFDLTRTLGAEAAVSAADAAERRFALRGREWDLDAISAWRRDLRRRVDAAQGARGVRQARWVVPFADGRAQLPGESVSRLQLVRIGFDSPDLQVAVAGPHEKTYFVDFGLNDVNAFGEFDGETKYLDESLRRGVSLEQVLLEEKKREDWIRGTTQRRLVRWGERHSSSPEALRARLAAFGIHPSR